MPNITKTVAEYVKFDEARYRRALKAEDAGLKELIRGHAPYPTEGQVWYDPMGGGLEVIDLNPETLRHRFRVRIASALNPNNIGNEHDGEVEWPPARRDLVEGPGAPWAGSYGDEKVPLCNLASLDVSDAPVKDGGRFFDIEKALRAPQQVVEISQEDFLAKLKSTGGRYRGKEVPSTISDEQLGLLYTACFTDHNKIFEPEIPLAAEKYASAVPSLLMGEGDQYPSLRRSTMRQSSCWPSWVIYKNSLSETDDAFVARFFASHIPSSVVVTANTLESLRSKLPQNLRRGDPDSGIHADQAIVETWG